jgi:hypothetical protein
MRQMSKNAIHNITRAPADKLIIIIDNDELEGDLESSEEH